MALKKCKKCEVKISTRAKFCSSCGISNPTKYNDWVNDHIESQKQKMNIVCGNEKCDRWLDPINVIKKKLFHYQCEYCGGPMRLYTESDAIEKLNRERSVNEKSFSQKINNNLINKDKVFYSNEYGWSFPGKYILLAIPAGAGLMYFENQFIVILLIFYLFGCVLGFIKGDR